ncbi:unnamed protein product [Pieris macdunnoughi]|uniref:Uncharacterized protein n=1 Tax=Pieris macdunnoughi TaxID=345717 RepID=A0A821TBE0_9NEOP|nr:unnamed protein product [Pieris macdunnoughi]
MTNTPMRLMSLQLRELILQLPKEHTNHILVTMASKMPSHEQHIGDYGEQDAVLLKKRSPVHPRTVHGQERPYKHVYCDDEYPDEVGEPSAACTDPSASSRSHEPHIAACTDSSASSRSHEPHIGDYGEQDAVLLKKRSPVHPRTVHGQERPYKHVYCDDEYPDEQTQSWFTLLTWELVQVQIAMTNTPMMLVSLQLRVLILLLPEEHTNHILVTMATKMPFS